MLQQSTAGGEGLAKRCHGICAALVPQGKQCPVPLQEYEQEVSTMQVLRLR